MSIGYSGEASGKIDFTITTTESQGWPRLSENHFGFQEGRSTVDAIQAEVEIGTKARRGTGKREGFSPLISIDIRNVFNTT